MESEKINKLDAILYVDVTCYRCKRSVAFSNTISYDGRNYCFRCSAMIKCKICGKIIKENTEGNLKYCQGH